MRFRSFCASALILVVLPALMPRTGAAQGVMAPVMQSTAPNHAQKPVAPQPRPTAPAAAPASTPAATASASASAETAPPTATGAVTKDPIPRFMALRFDEVNVRAGPSTTTPIAWVYHRRDFPVEVIAEIGEWRKLQDHDQPIGWVKASSLWKRRSVVIVGTDQILRAKPDDTAAEVAKLRVDVVLHVLRCPADQGWCEVEINAYRGWIKRSSVYGLYPKEAIEG